MEPKQVQQQVAGERKEKQHQHQHEQQQQQQTVRALVQDGSGEQAAGAGGDEAQLWTLLAAVKESFHNGLHLIYNKFSDEVDRMGRGMVGRLRAYDSECKQEGEEAQELKERLATLQANIGGLAIIGGLQGQGQQRARGGAGAALGGGGER